MCRVAVCVFVCAFFAVFSTLYVYTSTRMDRLEVEGVVKTMLAVNPHASACNEPEEHYCDSVYPTPYGVFDTLNTPDTECPYIRHAVLSKIDATLNRHGLSLSSVTCNTHTPIQVNGSVVVVNKHFADAILTGGHSTAVLAYIVYPAMVAKNIDRDSALAAIAEDASYLSIPLHTVYGTYEFIHTAATFYDCYTGAPARKLCRSRLGHII